MPYDAHVAQDNSIDVRIGEAIARHRSRRGWSQGELAKRCWGPGADYNRIGRLEGGLKTATFEEVGTVEQALELPPLALALDAGLVDLGALLRYQAERLLDMPARELVGAAPERLTELSGLVRTLVAAAGALDSLDELSGARPALPTGGRRKRGAEAAS